ncbi:MULTISPECIES: helix-turn-helix domain-containing protein [unclassified Mesorhizobium]|uniref:helix-turn-helix domain-containing protein n=1 Tax=unclassified Mesorhizobium TaxID=325217 RepID=UPI002882E589|nr:helix-turn-helix domain-containing protein [Mesorhizobium sp. P13.3]
MEGTNLSERGNGIDELSRPSTKPVRRIGAPEHEIAGCDSNDTAGPALGPRRTERDRLIDTMEKAGWVQANAARILRLTPRQVG